MKKAFTLAEVMIVLTVIGVLTAILLPVARQSMPDENLMKFKKAHNTLGTVIRELVTSDKYYLDGDLGIKPDSSLVDNPTYFCETLADVLNVKENNCDKIITETFSNDADYAHYNIKSGYDTVFMMDNKCRDASNTIGEIYLTDGVVFYETAPAYHFNSLHTEASGNSYELFKHYKDDNGFNAIYKVVCIDIDKINEGEEPFGYGIRSVGKILTGKRAQEWLERDVNEE